MHKFILNLKITKKLNLLSFVGIFGLLVSTLSVVFMLMFLDKQREKFTYYSVLRADMENVRISYNTMRGDVLMFFFLDPVAHKDQLAQTTKHYDNTIRALKEKISVLDNVPEEDQELRNFGHNFSNGIREFLALSEETKKDIFESATASDSVRMIVKNDIIGPYDKMYVQLVVHKDALIKAIDLRKKEADEDLQAANQRLFWLTIFIAIFTSLAVFFASSYIGKQITTPINQVKEIFGRISAGELPQLHTSNLKNEIGDMMNSLKVLVSDLNNLKEFTQEVGKGNFETDIVIFQGKGDIANSILSMKNNLKTASEVERKQSWISQGLADTVKLLRKSYSDSHELYRGMITFAVKYISANQGSFFIVNDDDSVQLELVACWAYNREKFGHKTIKPGEGLVGQAYLEKELIYLREIPKNYIQITSGLGDANPTNLIIIPLINNGSIQGIIEIASFKLIEDYQIDFLRQFADTIAAEIASDKINSRTQQILKISQQQTEELRAQEEEMRQNMEELAATQEEMDRRAKDMQAEIDALKLENDRLRMS